MYRYSLLLWQDTRATSPSQHTAFASVCTCSQRHIYTHSHTHTHTHTHTHAHHTHAHTHVCAGLVCSGVWMAASTSSLVGKVLACWVPITTFVCIGLVGCVCVYVYAICYVCVSVV